VLDVLPQLVGNRGIEGLKLAIADPDRYAIEPKVDGVRGLDGVPPGRHDRDAQPELVQQAHAESPVDAAIVLSRGILAGWRAHG